MRYIAELRREAKRRKRQRESDSERGEGSADAQEMAQDDRLLSTPGISTEPMLLANLILKKSSRFFGKNPQGY